MKFVHDVTRGHAERSTLNAEWEAQWRQRQGPPKRLSRSMQIIQHTRSSRASTCVCNRLIVAFASESVRLDSCISASAWAANAAFRRSTDFSVAIFSA